MLKVRFVSLLFALAACFPVAVFAAEPVVAGKPADWKPIRPALTAGKPLTPPSLLIERLASPRFVERVEATRELSRGGIAAVAPLRDAAASPDADISIRAVAALENLWLRAMEEGDDAAAVAALTALDDLSVAGDPAQRGRVESLLASYELEIEKFAVDEIRRLGGSVRYNESIGVVDDNGNVRPQIQYVVIGSGWQGGEEGLRHIRRAQPSSGVYFIKGAKLPEGAPERFGVESGLQIAIRGASYLGVQSESLLLQGVEGCLVAVASPGSPAAKAGIRQGDLIVEFNGKKVVAFETLVKEIEVTKPGQEVNAVVRRLEPDPAAPGQAKSVLKTLTVTMEEWR